MAALAAVCGVTIVLFGLFTAGTAPSDIRLGIEVTSFVGGLVLCFLAVVLARLARIGAAIESWRSEAGRPTPDILEDEMPPT